MRNYASFAFPLLLALALIPASRAQIFDEGIYGQALTDKPFYSPGDTGKLTIDLKNLLGFTIMVNNLTVTFPWSAYINGQWDGNSTLALNVNVTNNQWMPQQTVSFTVPNDGRFTSLGIFGGGRGGVWVRYTSYCPSCGSGRDGSRTMGFNVFANSFLLSTGWQAISNYLLYTDILLAALAVLFLIYILRSRQKGPAMPPVTPTR